MIPTEESSDDNKHFSNILVVEGRVQSHFIPWEYKSFSPLFMKDECKNQSVLPVKIKEDLTEITSNEKYEKVSIKY